MFTYIFPIAKILNYFMQMQIPAVVIFLVPQQFSPVLLVKQLRCAAASPHRLARAYHMHFVHFLSSGLHC